ncbi:UNVERIFIED_CONTAM: Retrovirus-related Pol polyprotein from transposon RE1 [Sesamum latifolium]|uniref:Retrovirus-related Pol polyprotein from transposon RE1 n=1 Tax=Sesamum latifolium TaxID=2727402 RepID=A0AAW2VF68_9LAMI
MMKAVVAFLIAIAFVACKAKHEKPFKTPLIDSRNGDKYDSVLLYKLSVQASIDEVSRVSEDFAENGTLTRRLLGIEVAGLPSAIESRQLLLSMAQYNLNRSVPISTNTVPPYDARFDFRTWLSAALADFDTCVHGFEYSSDEARNIVFESLDNSTKHVINSLSVSNNKYNSSAVEYRGLLLFHMAPLVLLLYMKKYKVKSSNHVKSHQQDSKGKKTEVDPDQLRVQATDNPGTVLVSNVLDGTNFLSWSRSIKIALRAKMKLGFINEKNPKPQESDDGFEQWERADGMVISWILNSISKDIVESFLYIDTASDLWVELESRYGVSNRPMIYQLQRKIASAAQRTLSVSAYFNKLKKLWDELGCLVTNPSCSPEALKEIASLYQRDHLMQFLMGLDESFESTRNQILIMEPLPNVSKAYAIVLQVERHREVNSAYGNSLQNMAMQTKGFQGNNNRNQWKRKGVQDKKNQYCTHCNKTGHLKEHCFEIYGYPDWYKNLVDQRKKGVTTNNRALNATNSQTEDQESVQNAMDNEAISEVVRNEVRRMFRQDGTGTSNREDTFAEYDDYAGKFLANSVLESSKCWIVDSGATSHMCNNINMFHKTKKSKPGAYIHLADGSKQHVKTVGSVSLSGNLELSDVLHVPTLKFNLLTTGLSKTVAIGKLIGKLYILDEHFFKTDTIRHIIEQVQDVGLAIKTTDMNLWHKRLGHTSPLVLNHLDFLKDNKTTVNVCEICPLAKQHRLEFPVKALLTATYIVNRLPTKTLNWKTHFEVLQNEAPDYEHMRIFGSLYFATNTQPGKKIFDARATKGIFLGYVAGHKGYRVFDLTSNTLFVSRDVVFHEDVFPYVGRQLDPITCPQPVVSDEEEVVENNNTELVIPHDDSTDLVSQPVDCLRRSTRTASRPAWMDDFQCHVSDSEQNTLFVATFTPIHSCFLAALTSMQEPKSYSQASKLEDWKAAMQSELDALEKNNTWEVTALPKNKRAIGCRWIFKLKLNADGSVNKHKARLVAKGYNQVEGIDYIDSFSPVAKAVTVRLVLSVAASLEWHLHHVDVNNAFLHGHLDKEIYMLPPEGYMVPQGHVCKLKRSLYGLKQASRQWNKEFTTKVKNYGFIQSKNDHCLFTKSTPTGFTRPDICHAAQQLSQFMQSPCKQHWDAALHLLRYLKGTTGKGLFFPSGVSMDLVAYSYPDWASCVDTRRSLTGFCIFLGTLLISWKTKKQHTVSRSTAEAEYRSMASATCELIWVYNLLQDFQITIHTPIPFLCDNQAALHIVANPVFHERTKHLEIDCHLVRDKFKEGFLALRHVPSNAQLADVFTKTLTGPSFLALISKLGLVDLPPILT